MSTAVGEGGSTKFDYDTLPQEVVSEAREAAERIRGLIPQHATTLVKIGNELIAIKRKLGHGQFRSWVDAEFHMSLRTAERYMRVASRFGARIDTMSILPPTTLEQLAAPSVPEVVRTQVLERLDAGQSISDSDVRSLIGEAKRQRKQAEGEPSAKAKRPDNPCPPEEQAPQIALPRTGSSVGRHNAKEAVEISRPREVGQEAAHSVPVTPESPARQGELLLSSSQHKELRDRFRIFADLLERLGEQDIPVPGDLAKLAPGDQTEIRGMLVRSLQKVKAMLTEYYDACGEMAVPAPE